MSRASLFIVLSIISLTFLVSIPASAQTQPEKWEYKKIGCSDITEADLNKHGDEGWELVSVSYGTTCYGFFFKRPKKERFHPTPPPPAGPPKCNLTLAQAPVIRGIRLGMSTDELLALFPRSKDQSDIIRELSRAEVNYGVVNLSFPRDTYPENKEMFSNNITYYRITLFDGRVASFSADYIFSSQNNRNPEWTYRTWILKLSETYNLPKPEDWFRSGTNYASIDCQDVRLSINASSDSASISITGLHINEQIKQRREAASEKLRSEFKP
jgi:hypothetical protein